MIATSTSPKSESTITPPEKMRLLLDRQRAAFAEDGIPTYEVRIDRTDRLIALMVENKDDIASALDEDFGHRSNEASLLTEVWWIIDGYKYNKLHLRRVDAA